MYREDSKNCDGLIYLDDKTRSFTPLKYVCMYAGIYLPSTKNRSFPNHPINEIK